ncbi:MAG: hypothetical protein CME88_17915 [Hirschia sp.]|nr:hypothetical protein [Hirschia sp.]MBF19113.1 hypothetical protein [Hirschia sp.]MBF20247.1 hypothetical protein [Hirschia sp.]
MIFSKPDRKIGLYFVGVGNIMFFTSRNTCFLDVEIEQFHIETWAWLIHCTSPTRLQKAQLILPTPDFFPKSDAVGTARAAVIFDRVVHFAQMDGVPIELRPEKPLAGEVSTFGHVQNGKHALGTHAHEGNHSVITYGEELIGKPIALIATFAHELGHALNGGFPYSPPGGYENTEPATDITSVFLGFGVFGANAAFNFESHQDFDRQGWSSSRSGYLTEEEWAFSIAIFCALKSIDVDLAAPFLKKHIWKMVSRAAKYVDRADIVAKIEEEAK